MGTIEIPKKQEYVIKMNSNEEFETNLIDGHIDALIIDSSEVVAITIESSLGYLIYHNSQHKGIQYYAPRALLQGTVANIIVQDQFEKFKINEPLKIRTMGPTNAEITIILRIS